MKQFIFTYPSKLKSLILRESGEKAISFANNTMKTTGDKAILIEEIDDLFEYPDLWPENLAKELNSIGDNTDTEKLKDSLERCKLIGWTFDYGLDGIPYELKPLSKDLCITEIEH
jgi:hypothetical protein